VVELVRATLTGLDQWMGRALRAEHPPTLPEMRLLKTVQSSYFQLRAALSEVVLFQGVQIQGKWFKRLAAMRHGKAVARRATGAGADDDYTVRLWRCHVKSWDSAHCFRILAGYSIEF